MDSLFGLAPGGVYPAKPVTGLAVRSYRTISPLPATQAVSFLWHFPSAHAARVLPGTLPCGARTFLCTEAQRLPGELRARIVGRARLPCKQKPRKLQCQTSLNPTKNKEKTHDWLDYPRSRHHRHCRFRRHLQQPRQQAQRIQKCFRTNRRTAYPPL